MCQSDVCKTFIIALFLVRYSDYTIKVKQVESGKTEWVKPSELMGYISGAFGNKVQEEAIDFMVDCFFGNGCKKE